jgi:hypothetical protein
MILNQGAVDLTYHLHRDLSYMLLKLTFPKTTKMGTNLHVMYISVSSIAMVRGVLIRIRDVFNASHNHTSP